MSNTVRARALSSGLHTATSPGRRAPGTAGPRARLSTASLPGGSFCPALSASPPWRAPCGWSLRPAHACPLPCCCAVSHLRRRDDSCVPSASAACRGLPSGSRSLRAAGHQRGGRSPSCRQPCLQRSSIPVPGHLRWRPQHPLPVPISCVREVAALVQGGWCLCLSRWSAPASGSSVPQGTVLWSQWWACRPGGLAVPEDSSPTSCSGDRPWLQGGLYSL